MATENQQEGNTQKVMQESWVKVEEDKPALTHVRSNEEVAELLAEAVSDEKEETGLAMRPLVQDTLEIPATQRKENVPDLRLRDIKTFTERFKDFLRSLFSPLSILSHFTVFCFGVLVGRRLTS